MATSTPGATTSPDASLLNHLTTGSALRVAWNRARAFTIASRVPVAGFLLAVWEWPLHLAVVAKEGDRIHQWRTASMTVDDRRRTTRPLSLTIAAAMILAAQIALLIGVGTLLSLALIPVVPTNVAALLGVLIAVSPTLLDNGLTAANRLLWQRESFTLYKRRSELAATGDAAVMTSLVRARGKNHRGEGAALLELSEKEWRARGMAVILYPANTQLVGFYRHHGAVIDDKADQRMIYDYQSRTPNTSR